jgi:hypothetical protein
MGKSLTAKFGNEKMHLKVIIPLTSGVPTAKLRAYISETVNIFMWFSLIGEEPKHLSFFTSLL